MPYVFIGNWTEYARSRADHELTDDEKIYSYRLSRIVENAFAILAQRFQIYLVEWNYPDMIGVVVKATCVFCKFFWQKEETV